jgi:hypothetical protein
LIFKDSPLFTTKTQTHIRREVARFHNFLDFLHVQMSDEPVSVAVDDKPKTNWRTQASTNGEFYNNPVAIPKEGLNDPKIITERYAQCIFWRLAQQNNRWHPPPPKPLDVNNPGNFERPIEETEAMFRMALSFHVAQYLSQSYWSDPVDRPHDLCFQPPYSTFSPIPFYLWEIRRAFGRDFADRLAVYTLIAAEKHPLAEDRPDYAGQLSYMQYVSNRIVFAEAGVDNDGSKVKPLQEIMNKCAGYWEQVAKEEAEKRAKRQQ